MNLIEHDRRQLLHYMRLSRAIEDAAWNLANQSRLVGRLYTGHGQEAIPVGSAYALAAHDVIAPMYRDLGAHLVRGVEPWEIFAQYMGKRDSSNRGKDSGLHIGDMARGIVGMISVLPDSLPVAAGVALAFQLRGEPRVAMTWLGEGATSTGAFHEAVNLAAVMRLPLVVIVENNQWALSTPASREYGEARLVDRAIGYGIAGEAVDGNDVEAVYATARRAVDRARAGDGPTLIEAMTMRMRGHSIIDAAKYVPAEQIAEWTAKDPIQLQRERLIREGMWDAQSDSALEALVDAAVESAVAQAAAMDDPRPEDAYVGVFAVAPPVPDVPPPQLTLLTAADDTPAPVRVLTYHAAIREALEIALREDERVFLLGEDIATYGGVYKVTDGLLADFGAKRVIDTPISENAIIGAATGAALCGLRPVAEIQFADFLACAMDPLVNMAAAIHYRWGQSVPMVVRAPTGATWASAGPFHSQSPEAWFAHTPGIKVVMPATPADAKGLLLAAIDDPNPVLFLEQKYLYRRLEGEVPEGRYTVPLGKARVAREGTDLTVVAWGSLVQKSLEAADLVADEGIDPEIIDLRSIVPWDRAAVIESVERTGRVLVVYEAHWTAGFGAEVAATIAEMAFGALDAPVIRLAGLDTPVPAHPILEQEYLPDERKIAVAMRKLVQF
jgi:2-oxoisovalerate dehydrogenase E1 component